MGVPVPKKYRNAWGEAVAVQDCTRRAEDRTSYKFTHDFDPASLPSICTSMTHAHPRIIEVKAHGDALFVVVRHKDSSPRKGENRKQYLKRVSAEDASVVGVAFGAVGRYVERMTRSGDRRAYDRRRSFRPMVAPVYA